MPTPSQPSSRFRFVPRPVVFLGAIVGVVSIHAAVLFDAPAMAEHEASRALPRDAAGAPLPSLHPLQLRLKAPVVAVVDPTAMSAPSPLTVPSAMAKVAPRTRQATHRDSPLVGQPIERAIAIARDAEPVVVAGDLQLSPVAASESDTAAAEPPATPATYRTHIPKSFTFRYNMQRGSIGGLGELQWESSANAYEAHLKGSIGGLLILGWTSTGTFDAAGLAPARYVDHRIGKSDQAANFQRTDGKITFSGSSNEYPIAAGSQDRLSWMIQLPAILAADPGKAKAGTRLSVFVVGAHGDAEVWVFESSGSEQVTTPSGTVSANKWSREPRRPYDTMVEVWLDPGRQYLPVKARLSAPPSDSPLELQLVRSES